MKTVSQVTLTFVEIFMSMNLHFFFVPDSRFRVLGKPSMLSQFGASIFAARPIRSSNFALGERKIKKNCPLLQQISIQKDFALCITLLLLLVMGSLLHMH